MISFNNVAFKYKGSDTYALKGINLTIQQGECILFTGRSGSGKSTILNMVNGIIPHHIDGEINGKILHHNVNLTEIGIQKLSEYVGSIFQNPKSQFFNLNTTDELLFGLSNHKADKELMRDRLAKTIEYFKLEKLIDRNIFKLSGGEKQKLACASVYMTDPDIIIFDEPSSNLDLFSIYELKNIIAGLKNEGKTILISEHRLYYLTEIADRVVYLNKGMIEKIMPIEKFTSLSDEERGSMGLRSIYKPILSDKLSYKSNRNEYLENTDMELKNFSYSYYKNQSIWNISKLQLKKGDIVGIIGKNGVGKTTLAYCLCGLYKSKGELKLSAFPKPINMKTRRQLCSMVMQDVNHQLFLNTVLKELLLKSKRNNSLNRAREVAQKLGISEFLEMHPLSLSGGQKQRVVIASAVMDRKEIIIMDEPTSGLDFTSMHNVLDLIKSISKDKIILIISHDIEFINRCCTRIFCL